MIDEIINAGEELLKQLVSNGKTIGDIKCAVISLNYNFNNEYHKPNENDKLFVLKDGHTQAELEAFMKQLDVEYDNSFGCQELFGYVMFHDESWLERNEYDGSEWWEYKKFFIPEECKRINN